MVVLGSDWLVGLPLDAGRRETHCPSRVSDGPDDWLKMSNRFMGVWEVPQVIGGFFRRSRMSNRFMGVWEVPQVIVGYHRSG